MKHSRLARLFSKTEAGEDFIQQVFYIYAPDQHIKGTNGCSQLFGGKVGHIGPGLHQYPASGQRMHRLLHRDPVAFAGGDADICGAGRQMGCDLMYQIRHAFASLARDRIGFFGQGVSLGAQDDIVRFRRHIGEGIGFDQKHAQIGERSAGAGTGDTDTFDVIIGFAQARGVEQGDRQACEVHSDLDNVAGGASVLR